jgi:hypothetical protein
MTAKETKSRAWQDNPDPPEDDHLEQSYDDAQNGGAEFDDYFDQWDDSDGIYSGEYSEM